MAACPLPWGARVWLASATTWRTQASPWRNGASGGTPRGCSSPPTVRGGKAWGNETIRVAPGDDGECSVTIRLPTPLAHLSNTPGRIPTYQLSDPIGWNHLADEWRAQVSSHQAVGYAIRLDAEQGRWYITASWSLPLRDTLSVEEAAQSGRCLAVDVNSGHLDARILDTHGNPIGRPVRKDIPQKGSSSHRLGALREAVSQLVKWAKQQGASVVAVEKLNFTDARTLGRQKGTKGQSGQNHPQKGVRHPHLQVHPHHGFGRLPPRHGGGGGRSRLYQYLGTEVLEEAARQISPATRRRPSGRRRCYRQKKPGTQREATTRHAPQPTRGLAQESSRTADRPWNWHGTRCRQRQARALTCGCYDRLGGNLTSGKHRRSRPFGTPRMEQSSIRKGTVVYFQCCIRVQDHYPHERPFKIEVGQRRLLADFSAILGPWRRG